MINEFFEITRFNLQNIELNNEDINLTHMLNQIADEFYPSYNGKGIKYNIRNGEDTSSY
ncbi:signal transduction histidine kinase [Clostridioides mangenotii]|uniref:Signal transduction histidine kinase n=1 Tax=Metaclostridioides mangenotii TaxID=1540 RepID=A0ABS4EBN9_9FIRM|nr:signal transduction histidine kinase [Clostridioides mangenotii]